MRARLAEIGTSKAELSRILGVSDATMTQLLGGNATSQHSRLVPAIHRALEWPPPPMPEKSSGRDPGLAELELIYAELTEAQKKALLSVAREFGPTYGTRKNS